MQLTRAANEKEAYLTMSAKRGITSYRRAGSALLVWADEQLGWGDFF